MRKIYLLVSAGVALAASGVALPQIPAPMSPAPGRTELGTLDTDRDGSISRTEASMNPALSAQFPMLDKNANGALEPVEFARFEGSAGMGQVPTAPPGGRLRPPTNPGNPPASLQLDTNTPPALNGTPPPVDSTPPPIDSTPPPVESTPPPLGTSPPPSGASPPPGAGAKPAPKSSDSSSAMPQGTTKPSAKTYQPRSATSAGGPGDED